MAMAKMCVVIVCIIFPGRINFFRVRLIYHWNQYRALKQLDAEHSPVPSPSVTDIVIYVYSRFLPLSPVLYRSNTLTLTDT